MIESSRLLSAKVVAFIDSNIHYQGKTLAGIPVVAPTDFNRGDVEVLISSQTAEDDIYQVITQGMGWSNTVHRLYTNL